MTLSAWLLAIALSSLFSVGDACAGEQATRGISSPLPPLLVSGTIVSGSARVALVVTLDGRGNPAGQRPVHEGEAIAGYRVASIRADQVAFERDGETFLIRVGNDRQPASTIDVVVPYRRKGEISGRFVPPPGNLEEVRKEVHAISERLMLSPAFRKGLQGLDRRLRETSEPRPVNP